MKKIASYIFNDKRLLKDNAILFIATFLMNVLAYVFHIYVGRFLGPEDYGIFGSLLSLIYIMIIPFTTIQTGIAKFVSEFKAKNEYGKISFLFSRSLKKMLVYGIIFVAVFLLISPLIAKFLKIDDVKPVMLLAPFFFFALLLHVTRGVLQGLQDFKKLGINIVSEGIIKLIVGIILLYVGFRVNGAIFAFVISYTIPFFVFLYIMRNYFKEKKEQFNTKLIYNYSLPVLLLLISLTAFYTFDVLLVKHFFNNIDAGHYAALALLGKVVLFGSISVPMVMFPKVSESYVKNQDHKHLLYKSSLFVLIFGSFVTLFYFLFSNFAIRILFGERYLDIANLLGWFGIAMTIFSLIYVISFYKISIKKTKFLYLLGVFNVLEIILIYLFHDSLLQIIQILIGLMMLLFILLLPTYKNETFNSNPSI
nr:oligosaccharide flippase family protein [Candidatus Woesearchaeota archaeon]